VAATIELDVERPVAGGRMLARHEGRIVLVSGAIPGERVRARIARTARHTVFADVVDVIAASPWRRTPFCDPRCGGSVYAHIVPEHQRTLKAAVVADAFRRLGGVTIGPPSMAGASEDGYRLRARLHVRGARAGFFLEDTHTLCDAAATRQLTPDAMSAVAALLAQLGDAASMVDVIVVSENVDASARVLHLELKAGARAAQIDGRVRLADGVTGVTARAGERMMALAGVPTVTDRAGALFKGEPPVPASTEWTRSGASFFQGNRFLIGDLVSHVLARVDGSRVLDLYSGVGLFAVALAAQGVTVTAIEGDAASGDDLELNAARWPSRIVVRRGSVEAVTPALASGGLDTIVLDPPRTGASAEALASIAALAAPRIVYVSCDPATLARDTKALIAAGYRLASVTGFDLFPNTAHVETVAVFDCPA
jgi:tRNA/tmRNA/rRNA uracil-C5-methylase (TrmA/RlmC/RlmD family)